jgi:hypothetical protein
LRPGRLIGSSSYQLPSPRSLTSPDYVGAPSTIDATREDETKQRVLTLDAWWAEKTLAEVNGTNCRAYVEHRTRQAWKLEAIKASPATVPEWLGRPGAMNVKSHFRQVAHFGEADNGTRIHVPENDPARFG